MNVLMAVLLMLDVHTSTDGGKTWKAAGLAGKAINEIVVDPRDPATAYAFVGGDVMNRTELHRTADGGKTWTRLDPGVELHCLAIDPEDAKVLYVGGREGAYAKSPDAGKTWTRGSIGEAARGGFGAKNVRGIAVLGKTLIAIGGQGDGFIATSADGGATWTKAGVDLGYAWCCAVAQKTVFVGGDTGLLASEDAKAFAARGDIAPRLGVGGRFSVSSDGKRVVYSFRGQVVASEDAGRTWKSMASPEKGTTLYAIAWVGAKSAAVVLNGKDGPEGFEPDGGAMLLLSDDGKTWAKAEAPGRQKACVVATSRDGKTLWLGTR